MPEHKNSSYDLFDNNRPKTQRGLVLIVLLCSILSQLSAQIDCDCEPITEINICYIDRNSYCDSNSNRNCGITLNHEAQIGGIALKLVNQENFGLNGTIKCPINIISIPEINSTSDIVSQNCNVFYVGNWPIDTLTGGLNSRKTSLTNKTLEAIYDWSVACSRHLAIVPQREALLWGYSIENLNRNPNSPVVGSNPFFSIFDGPFGRVESFSQGGTYQGVITDTPSTGHVILARDRRARPTIALDFVSTDLIIGDIGFFSVPNSGSLSEGDKVLTNNDKLACNIFALACQLVSEFNFKNERILLCKGDSYVLPLGEVVSEEGIYLDTLIKAFDCDTIVNTQIEFYHLDTDIEYSGCQGDGYEIQVGTEIYNEQNNAGTQSLISSFGCDSIINILLNFAEPTSGTFEETLCENDDQTFFTINGTVYDINNQVGTETIINQEGCDSTVFINLEFTLNNNTSSFKRSICEDSNESFTINGNIYNANNLSGTEVIPISVGCDSIVEVDLNIVPKTFYDYTVNICNNSDTVILINGNNYDINNPTGTEIVLNAAGCDSIINVNLNVLTSFTNIDTSLCVNDDYSILLNNNEYNLNNPIGEEYLINQFGCDSIITINFERIELDTQFIELEICTGNSLVFESNTYFLGDQFMKIDQNSVENQCDIVNRYTVVNYDEPSVDFDTTLLIDNFNGSELNLNLENVSEIIWTPSQGLSCQNCISPNMNSSNSIENYTAEIIDNNACRYVATVTLDYIRHPFIPTVFAPNGISANQNFRIFINPKFYTYNVEIQNLVIFDKWGNLINSIDREILTNDLVLWDGNIGVKEARPGTFAYAFELKYPDDRVFDYKGTITVLK